jgi:PAS domain S-box-containing protein
MATGTGSGWGERLRSLVEQACELRDRDLLRERMLLLGRIASAPDPRQAFLIHDGHRIRAMSDPLVHLLDWTTAARIVGASCTSIVHPDDIPLVDERIEAIYESHVPNRPMLFRLQTSRGEIRFADVLGVPIRYDGRVASMAVAYPRIAPVHAVDSRSAKEPPIEPLVCRGGRITPR